MEPKGSLPHLQVPDTSPCPKPDPSSPRTASHLLKTHFNIILPSTPGLPSGLLPSVSPTKALYTPLLCPMCATCPAHLILLYLISRKIFGEEYRPLSSAVCSFHHWPVTSSLLGPNILRSTLSSSTLSLRSSLNVSDQISHPYKTGGKGRFLFILIFVILHNTAEDKDSAPTDSNYSLTSICTFFSNTILIFAS